MGRRYPLKKYQLWIGSYHLGQGYDASTEPQLLDEIEATDFKVACVLHELRRSLKSIEGMIAKDQYVDHQSCRWFYDFDKNANSWTGKYFETKEEAQQSFNR
jgi:hypothetical protein